MAYPWQNMSPTDDYRIEGHPFFDTWHIKVVTFLYQPLIKGDAYRLWMLLIQEKRNTPHLLSHLLSLLDLGLADFYQARIRLEGVGLLQTYQKDASYVLHLNRPLDPAAFYEEDILRLALVDQVGEAEARRLFSNFDQASTDKADYKNLTKKYLDVYAFRPSSTSLKNKTPSKDEELPSISPPADEVPLDFALVQDLVSDHFVNPSELERSDLQNLLASLHVLYGMDEQAIAQLLTEAADVSSGKVDLKEVEKVVRRYQQNKAIQLAKETRKSLNQEKAQTPIESFSKDEQGLIQAAKDIPPMAFLTSIKEQMGGQVTRGEQLTLTNLVKQSGLSQAVINILIHYLIQQEQKKFNDFTASEVADAWLQEKVATPEDAMNAAKKAQRRRQERTQKQARQRSRGRVEKLPDWAKKETKQKKADPAQSPPKDQQSVDQPDQAVDFDAWLKAIREEE